MPEPPRTVLLSGYYGYANVGDDAIFLALTGELRACGVERILVPAGEARERLAGPGIEFLARRDWAGMARALAEGAAVVSGGGGLFQDATSLRSLGYYLNVLRLARRAGRPYLICAQSIGPLRHRLSRWAVCTLLRRAAAISVRDERSRDTLAGLGLDPARVQVTADPAFALGAPAPAPAAEPTIGLCLRPTRHTANVLAALRAWWPQRPAPVTALACQAQDEAVHAELAGLPEPPALVPADTVEATLARVAACDLVIAERLHAMIFAVLTGTPCLAIDYDPKVRGLAEDLGVPVAGTDAGLDPRRLAELATRLWAAREAESERLARVAAAARQRVRDDLRTLFGALA